MDRLQAMHAYVRVIELGSFSRAGVELRVRQSTISKWIAALEDQLDATLIERTSRSQRPTEAGQRFYARCKDILASYATAEAELHERAPDLRGRLRVSVPVVFGRLHVVPHLPSFVRRHPELELELSFDDRYVQLLDDGFDVLLRVGAPVDSSLRARTLARTRRCLVAAPRYLREAGTPDNPRALRDHECLVHTAGAGQWAFTRAGKTHRVQVGGRVRADHSEATLALARAGLGIALLASWLVGPDLARGRLVAVLPEYQAPTAPIQALLPPTREVHPRVRAFLDHLAPHLAALA